MSPRIVVVMSVYNDAQYLAETIPAVLNQTMGDFGLLLFDNGSTDETRYILEGFAYYDDRIHCAWDDKNLSPAITANRLTAIACQKWVDLRWILGAGADDIMAPDYLDAVRTAANAHPDANCIFSPWGYIGRKDTKRFPDYDPNTIHAEHQIPAWSAITRELCDALNGHDEKAGVVGSDWDFFVRASVAGVLRTHQLDRPYIAIRERSDRKSLSEQSHWPTLHRHLCTVAGKPVPAWAQ